VTDHEFVLFEVFVTASADGLDPHEVLLRAFDVLSDATDDEVLNAAAVAARIAQEMAEEKATAEGRAV
jgi:hypothetical protein